MDLISNMLPDLEFYGYRAIMYVICRSLALFFSAQAFEESQDDVVTF